MIKIGNKKILVIIITAMVFFGVSFLEVHGHLNANEESNPVVLEEQGNYENVNIEEEEKGVVDSKESKTLGTETFNAIFPDYHLASVVAESLGKVAREFSDSRGIEFC